MSPRPGGESDKLGNKYEAAWTVFHVIEVLAGRAQAITVEAHGDEGWKVEFVLERANRTEVHQLKRQRARASEWTRSDFQSEGLLAAAKGHVLAGRHFHFVSMVPAPMIKEVAHRARASQSLELFLADFRPEDALLKTFEYVAQKIGGPADAWATLQQFYTHSIDDYFLVEQNATLAGYIFDTDSPATVGPTLRELVEDHLGVRLDRGAITALLPDYDLKLADLTAARQRFLITLPTLFERWQDSVASELIDPHIDRAEVLEVEARLRARSGVFFIAGDGGTGKSAVLHDVARALKGSGWPGVAFRIDREQPFSSSYELGVRHGLGVSPVSALGSLSSDEPSLLIIDQLDAVSLASGRMPEIFFTIQDMIREASAFGGMRVVVACRKFDLENDPRIRTLVKRPGVEQIDIQALSEEQIKAAVRGMGLPAGSLTPQQLRLLSAPFPLKLLSAIPHDDRALSFTSLQDLQEAFWEAKAQACNAHSARQIRFNTVVARLALLMSERQQLSVPWSALDQQDLTADAGVLVSEHVLVREGRGVSFFHESFFDYAFARQWTESGQSLVEFLAQGEQELFRRSQLRQILVHLRLADAHRFCVEFEEVLSASDVRFHLKQVAIAVARSLQDPSASEWRAVQRLISSQPDLSNHLWALLRTRPWFERADAEGEITRWLSSGNSDQQAHALEMMASAVREVPDRIAELIAPHATVETEYPGWLRWILRPANSYDSRPLFDLMLDSVRRGEYNGHEHELFLSTYNLSEHNSAWAVELIKTYWADRPNAIPDDPIDTIPALDMREHSAIELIIKGSRGAPGQFVDQVFPYLIRVLEREALDLGGRTRVSSYFRYSRAQDDDHHVDAGGAIISAARHALQVTVAEADEVPAVLNQLAAIDDHTAQWLLYEALAVSTTTTLSEYAAACLLDRPEGFLASHDSWSVRELVAAIAGQVSVESLARLEAAILDLRPEWEKRYPGSMTHTILSGMPIGILSDVARRRLGELNRRYPEATRPGTITGGGVPSPIPQSAVPHMTDQNWLQAMQRHNTGEREPWDFRGGANELSQLLNDATKKDPARFARLALQLDRTNHVAYGSAILRGLGEAEVDIDSAAVFVAVLHLGGFGRDEVDRWLGWSVRKYLKAEMPEEVVDLLLDRMLNSPDPSGDWQPSGVERGDLDHDDLLSEGFNCVRGHTAELLGDYLVYDADGTRTAHIVSSLPTIASDASAAVKSCSARLLSACLRFAQTDVMAVLDRFFAADDRLLASRYVRDLMVHASYRDLDFVEGLVSRMTRSTNGLTRQAGGQIAAFLGLEHGRLDVMNAASASPDPRVRRGLAEVASARLPHGSRGPETHALLVQLFADDDEQVRREAANVGMHLRERSLLPFADTLIALIGSMSFRSSLPQLFLTLQYAPDRVHDLVALAARRFIDDLGSDAGDIRTAASGDAHYVGELVMRAFVQSADAAQRKESLDLIDDLLRTGTYGMEDLLMASERTV